LQCSGAAPQTCNAACQWVSGSVCIQPTPTCAGGHCTCAGIQCTSLCTNASTDTSNCGACGHACSGVGANSTSCSNGTCAPACQIGRQNCVTPIAPSADDGCECVGTGCCGKSCQTRHDNGTGDPFYDCSPVGTYSQASAVEACAALTGDASLCQSCAGTFAVQVVRGAYLYRWYFMAFSIPTGYVTLNYYPGELASCPITGGDACGGGNATLGTCTFALNQWN
jgi:hypothetical protein